LAVANPAAAGKPYILLTKKGCPLGFSSWEVKAISITDMAFFVDNRQPVTKRFSKARGLSEN